MLDNSETTIDASPQARPKACTVSVHGFNNIGIGVIGDITASHAGALLDGCWAYENWDNIDTAPGGANHDTALAGTGAGEYAKIVGCTSNYGRYGVVIGSGNVTATGNALSHNGYGVYITGSTNPGHGTWVGNICNHSVVRALTVIGMGYGFTIAGNQWFYGDWYLESNTGLEIGDNHIVATNMTLSGSGWVDFHDNWFYENTVITDYSTGTDWCRNWNNVLGAYVNNKGALIVDPTQIQQVPAGHTTGGELVTDGGFDNPADWTFEDGWTISGSKAHSSGATADTHTLLYQGAWVTTGTWYRIRGTISGYTAGVLDIGLGGAFVGGPGARVWGNGSFELILYSRATVDPFFYLHSAGFVGDLDNVSVYAYVIDGQGLAASGDYESTIEGHGVILRDDDGATRYRIAMVAGVPCIGVVGGAMAPIGGTLTPSSDAGNSHTGAIGAGATFAGATQAWDAYLAIDIVGSNDAAGTITVRQRVAGVWLSESWLAPITAVGSEWVVAANKHPGADAYNVQFVDGGAGGAALVLTTERTGVPIDSMAPCKRVSVAVLGAANDDTTVIPVGARSFDVQGTSLAGGNVLGNLDYAYQHNAAHALTDTSTAAAAYGACGRRMIEPTTTHINLAALGGSNATFVVRFYR